MQVKNVVIVGVLNDPTSTNVSMARAFQKLGYNVIPVNYRTVIKNSGQRVLQKYLLRIIEKHEPELILFCKCNGVNPEIVRLCTERATTWWWNPDVYHNFINNNDVIQIAKYASYASCTIRNTALWFISQGVDDCMHFLDGADEDLFKPVDLDIKYMAEMSFIGNNTSPTRSYYKKFLESEGINVQFYGNGFNKGVYNDEFAKVCSSSNTMLSLNTFADDEGGFSNRLFRYLCCGSCTFHLDPSGTIGDYFEDGKEIILFQDENELVQKLHKLTTEDMKKIGEAGRKKVLENYTWVNSMRNILNTIGVKI